MKHERLWTLGNKLRASEGREVGEWDRLVMGSKEGTYWSTGCYMQTMNHGTLHQKLRIYCLVTNTT